MVTFYVRWTIQWCLGHFSSTFCQETILVLSIYWKIYVQRLQDCFGPPQVVIFDLVENIKGSPENSTW